MAQSQILEIFIQEVDDALLKELLRVYNLSLDLTEDERVANLIANLENIFEERNNASQQA